MCHTTIFMCLTVSVTHCHCVALCNMTREQKYQVRLDASCTHVMYVYVPKAS